MFFFYKFHKIGPISLYIFCSFLSFSKRIIAALSLIVRLLISINGRLRLLLSMFSNFGWSQFTRNGNDFVNKQPDPGRNQVNVFLNSFPGVPSPLTRKYREEKINSEIKKGLNFDVKKVSVVFCCCCCQSALSKQMWRDI